MKQQVNGHKGEKFGKKTDSEADLKLERKTDHRTNPHSVERNLYSHK